MEKSVKNLRRHCFCYGATMGIVLAVLLYGEMKELFYDIEMRSMVNYG